MKSIPYYIFSAIWMGILGYLTIRLVSDTDANIKFWLRPLSTTLTEILGSILIAGITFYCLNRLILSNHKIPISKYLKEAVLEKVVKGKLLKK